MSEENNEIEKEISKAELRELMKKRPFFQLTDEEISAEISERRTLFRNKLISEDEKARLFAEISEYENELRQRPK